MINKNQLEKLSEIETASWAIWREVIDKKYCIENKKELKNDVIFVGLNRSGKKNSKSKQKNNTFINFHTFGHKGDGLLKDTIPYLDYLSGAYMTDLSTKIEADGNKVIIEKDAKKRFEKQLDILGADKFTIICFGGKVFNFFKKEYCPKVKVQMTCDGVKIVSIKTDKWELKIFGIWHYTQRYKSNDIFKKHIEYVNKEIGRKIGKKN